MNDALSGDKGLLFPDAGTNVVCTFGDAAGGNPDLFAGLRGRGQRGHPEPPGRRRPRWSPARPPPSWGEDGRLTAWIPNQGAQGTKGAIVGALGLEPEEVRIITPDVGGAFGAKFGADAEHAITCWIAKQLGRPDALVGDADGEPAGHAARPGAAAEDHDRRHEGRHRPRLPDRDPAGLRRLPEVRRVPAVADDPDDPGPVPHTAGRVVVHVGRHQHHAGRRLPGRGPPGGRRRDRPGDGPVRRRGRGRPGRGPAEEPAAQVHRAAHDRVRRQLRLGRLRDRAREGARRGRLPGRCWPSRRGAAPAATRCSSASGFPPTWRSPGRAARPAARTRTAPSRSTRTAPPPC